MQYIKIIFFYLLRRSISVISLFLNVKNNRILFTSFNGKQYSCNPKYILEYLIRNSTKNYEFILVLNNKINDLPSCIKTVKYMSWKNIYYYFTSKIIITNMGFKSIFKKPKGQYRIETWHGGGAYKRTDLDICSDMFKRFRYKLVGEELNYYIASCAAFAKLMAKAQCIPSERFLKIGMPRNDIFFIKSKRAINNKKVRDKYCLKENWKIILYAPTWRDDGRASKIKDICEVVSYLNKVKPEKHILLCRAHHSGNLTNNFNVEEFINVTNYPDMQELLCAADILITDYSSCMWDFSLMYKPCFIYATDIDQYKQERDFYTPMSEWPFPIATNTDELINNILNFNQKEYVQKVKQHHKDLGSFEDGHACERVCKLIEDIIDGKVQK